MQLINSAAFNEFSAAARSLSGQADLQVRGAQPLFDEAIYPRLATEAGVALASPVLALDVTVPEKTAALPVLGVDVFKASRIAPDLTGVPAPDHPFDTLASDTIFLSTAAQQWLNVKPGDSVALRRGTSLVHLRVAGGIVRTRPGQRLAVMDIAAAQWRFGAVGKLSRIDVQLERGVDRERFRRELQARLGRQWVIAETRDAESRTDRLSRAYRINMNVLALVALFTGAFLVFSTQALGVVRRRSQFAMLRVLGLTRGQLLRQILLEGALLGVLGSLLRIALGFAMASGALRFFGSDLGGGYFPGVQPTVGFEPARERDLSCARDRRFGARQSCARARSGACAAGCGTEGRRGRSRAGAGSLRRGPRCSVSPLPGSSRSCRRCSTRRSAVIWRSRCCSSAALR